MRAHNPRNKIKLRMHTAPLTRPQVPRDSPTARGYGAAWRRLRGMVLAQSPLCARCQAPAAEVDHVLPKSKGGTDHLENLQALCRLCHNRKTYHEDGCRGGLKNDKFIH